MKEFIKNWNEYLVEEEDDLNIKIIISSLHVKDSLKPDVWPDVDRRADPKLDPEIREKLLEIAQNYFDDLGLPDIEIEDITFTGSLANYNWSESSDIDLHIILDFNQFSEQNEEFIRMFFRLKNSQWNKAHKIMIKGHEVEIYVQGKDEPHASTGVYSVSNDEWNIVPSFRYPEIDWECVRHKAENLKAQIDDAQEDYEEARYERAFSKASTLRDKIGRLRKSGLEKGGVYSVENLAFKTLRRNEYLDKLRQLSLDSYDKMMSIQENFDSDGGLWEIMVQEVYSKKQRKWACAQAGKSRENFRGKLSLSKKKAEEMCKEKTLKKKKK